MRRRIHIVADRHRLLVIVEAPARRVFGPFPYDGNSRGNPYLRFQDVLRDKVGIDDCKEYSITVSCVTSGDLSGWTEDDPALQHIRIVPKTANAPVWFVRRASDDRMLCVDGKWRGSVGIGDIKTYSSAGRAERYGLKGCAWVDSSADGSLQTRGSCYAIHPGESIDSNGRIYNENDEWIR